jgi:UDP-galactopyranose mutase
LKDWIIVGAGISGATAARALVNAGHKDILVLDSRNHVGGNTFDEFDSNGVLVHRYGPHIFHTQSEKIFTFLSNFTDWIKYEHKVLGQYSTVRAPVPFNLESLEKLWPGNCAELIADLKAAFPEQETLTINQLLNSNESLVAEFGKFVFDNVYKDYSLKQWGQDILLLSPGVLSRVPVRLNYDPRYFEDKYQYMPKLGYTQMIKNMLLHESVDVQLATQFNPTTHKARLGILYCGSLDELHNYSLGKLPYRSLRFEFEYVENEDVTDVGTINYLNSLPATRVSNMRVITQQDTLSTVLVTEYPEEYMPGINQRFYPIPSDENRNLFHDYESLTKEKFPNLSHLGRLGDYKYYNMDQAVARALQLVGSILN